MGFKSRGLGFPEMKCTFLKVRLCMDSAVSYHTGAKMQHGRKYNL